MAGGGASSLTTRVAHVPSASVYSWIVQNGMFVVRVDLCVREIAPATRAIGAELTVVERIVVRGEPCGRELEPLGRSARGRSAAGRRADARVIVGPRQRETEGSMPWPFTLTEPYV